MAESRTAKSIRNSSVALVMYLINLILQFYSRKIFLEYLGTEILGLNSTATNLLQFLNLAELGISSAVSFSLYKPLYYNDIDTINEIVSLQGYIYKRIATGIIFGSCILMLFFPWIFSKMVLPLWYAYLSFGVLLFSSLLGYFVNYKQVLLSANQEEYMITISYKSILNLKVLAQMVAVWRLTNGYIWWAILELVFSVIASISLHYTTKHRFPCLRKAPISFKELRNKYKVIESKIKQLFFHKASGYVLAQTSPLILYAYTSLASVSYYQNYMLIYLGIISLMASIFNGITAGIGNVSVETHSKLSAIFNELFSIRFFFAALFSLSFYVLSPRFVSLWIGPEYILPDSTVLLMTIVLFIAISRQTVENYLYSLGMFQDILAPVIELSINIILSVIFGYYWGLNGILLGVISSLISIVMLWKPYFLYKYGLKIPVSKYIILYIRHIAALTISIILTIVIFNRIHFPQSQGWIDLIIYAISYAAIFSSILLASMVASGCEIKILLKRLYALTKR